MSKPRVLFLCTGNSCRSQMAEGFARHLLSEHVEAYSAGIEAHGMNRHAVRVMREIGIDISGHHSKTLAELEADNFHTVVTVCAHADAHCPSSIRRERVLHHEFDDPPRLAASAVDEQMALGHYRRVRDEIGDWMRGLPEVLNA